MIKNNSKFLQLLCLIRPRTLENVCFLIQKFRFEARREDPQESSGVWSHFLCKPMVRGGARITFESIKRPNSSHIQVNKLKKMYRYIIMSIDIGDPCRHIFFLIGGKQDHLISMSMTKLPIMSTNVKVKHHNLKLKISILK